MGNRQAIDQVMRIMETSDDWYSQWYAYRALRSLGWKQKKLN
jgi:HEAT repeat protein